ncbi:MAG: valine--tRNA ligase [Alphaproteobacteria bacterium]|nr:MAG: valine--tRNA ligase [Alphaproteobacteria bacterium]
MEKHYSPRAIEEKWYGRWESEGAFQPQHPDAEPYCIVIPPPNVTGSLHMGHALNSTLQDILVRFERLRGKDVLWQPGTDHAGIATQMVVERELAKEGLTRQELGREEFLKRVWEWKERSGGTIVRQLKRLGASADWSRSRFTMDEGLSRAVIRVFVTYYREGLIYRDKRLVNWDPKLKTAISDLEVVQREVDGHFWHIRYPVEGSDESLIVATTRPETMLGDTAVAVHPEDERYRHLIGERVRLPLVGRLIPIVADEHADPEQGSGAVKITPAHDFNDFEVARRHDLPMISIFDEEAQINDQAPERYRGLDRFTARKRIVADLEEQGFLVKIEPKRIMMPYGDRSGVVVEPFLTDQWFVDAEKLAGPAIEAVRRGDTRFVPPRWAKTYFQWLENIQPWCISRQLWWGHRIPAWYGPDGAIFVAETEEEAYAEAREQFGPEVRLERDPDVLDTWFSSALWPFSTLGWPDETPELKRFYPTSTLVTGFDIIFFWVARMMMAGLHFMKDVPFRQVYITGLVRDAKGEKMSKSKGNVIDPLEFIEKYGADALRFTLAALETQGRDIKLSESRVEGYRNFATKLWNAARFCRMNEIRGRAPDAGVPEATLTVNRWILSETRRATAELTAALESFRFDVAANTIYHFVWHTFCDWHLEFIKPLLAGEDEAAVAETRAVAGFVLDTILAMLHPFMPFITEELWHAMAPEGAEQARGDLIVGRWPVAESIPADAAAEAEIDWTIRLISEIRSARTAVNVPAAARIPALVRGLEPERRSWLAAERTMIERLARLSEIREVDALSEHGAVMLALDDAGIALPVAEVIDIAEERARLAKAVEKARQEAKALEKRLSNPKFVERAPAEVVEETRARLAEARALADRLAASLARLGG